MVPGIQSRPQVIASDSRRGGSQFSTIFKVSLCIFDGICLSARDYFYVSTHSALALFHSATAAHVGTTDGVVLHNVEINLATTSINSALDMHATENSFTVKVRITLQFNPDYLLIYFMKTDNCVFGLVKGIWSCCTAITLNFPHGTPHKWCFWSFIDNSGFQIVSQKVGGASNFDILKVQSIALFMYGLLWNNQAIEAYFMEKIFY